MELVGAKKCFSKLKEEKIDLSTFVSDCILPSENGSERKNKERNISLISGALLDQFKKSNSCR